MFFIHAYADAGAFAFQLIFKYASLNIQMVFDIESIKHLQFQFR